MSANRKPRGDAKLKTLPEARQEQIAEMLAGKTLAEVKKELASDGLMTSLQALSEFWSWWQLRQQFSEKETLVQELMEQLKVANPSISEEQLFEHGQTVFAFLALQDKDSLSWKRVQDARFRRQQNVLLERRVKLLEQKAAQAEQAQQIIEDKELSPEQITAKIKGVFGIVT